MYTHRLHITQSKGGGQRRLPLGLGGGNDNSVLHIKNCKFESYSNSYQNIANDHNMIILHKALCIVSECQKTRVDIFYKWMMN